MKKWSTMLMTFAVTLVLSVPVSSMEANNSVDCVHSWHYVKQKIKQAKAYIKENGSKAYIQALKAKKFDGQNEYMFAIDYRGNILAHPFVQLHDVNGWDFYDSDRVYMVREMVKMAKYNGKGWIEYQFKHHQTGQVVPQLVYIERVNNRFFIGLATY
ncbi:cache domain-containing protein [Parashewanella tropica]|uniref:cache domain-containing protein n=1 Tax=Parashewanella tropica TaxID=2547970 RepID=UPI001059D9C2|nr:cache domain-containing protein [Parashewanella tropica]